MTNPSFQSPLVYTDDIPQKTVYDTTTDPLYVFVSKAAHENLATSAKGWQVYRITVASGNLSAAKVPTGGLTGTDGKMIAAGVATFDYVFIADSAATYSY